MNIVKNVVKAVWPIVLKVLQSAAEKTESEVDDAIVKIVNGAIEGWLEDEENQVNFG
jgi:hypothetical protein